MRGGGVFVARSAGIIVLALGFVLVAWEKPIFAGERIVAQPDTPSDSEIIQRAWGTLATYSGVEDERLRHVNESGDLKAQEGLLTEIIDKNPDRSVPHALRGFVRFSQYRVQEAMQDFVAAQSLGDMDRDLKAAVQRAKLRLGQIASAAVKEGVDPSYIALLRDVGSTVRMLDAVGDKDGLDTYLGTLFGYDSILPYAAVRRGFLRLARSGAAGGEDDLRLAGHSNPSETTKSDIEMGLRLGGELRASPALVTDGKIDPSLVARLPDAPWESKTERFEFAESVLESKRYDWLEQVLSQLRTRFPDDQDDSRISYYAAEIAWGRGDFDSASRLYTTALDMTSSDFLRANILLRLAEFQAKQGARDKAVELAEQAAVLQPGQEWLVQRVGTFLVDLGERDKGVAYLDKARALAATRNEKIRSYSALADTYLKMGDREKYLDNAAKYVAEVESFPPPVPPAYRAQSDYYQAEILQSRGESDEAQVYYELASGFVKDPFRLSDIYQKMARLLARRGEWVKASEYMEKSVALFSEQAWKLRQAGDFYSDLGMTDKALAYYDRALEQAVGPAEQAPLYLGIAEIYRRNRDTGQYLAYARKYIDSLAARGTALSPEEEGIRSYYLGDLYTAETKEDAAQREYKHAADLVKTPVPLSDIYMKMAQYRARMGDKALASEYMDKSVALLPDQVWKLRQAGDFYYDLDMTDLALRYYGRALALATVPADQSAIYSGMAESYKKSHDTENYLSFARKYVDAMAGRKDSLRPEEEGLRAYYRGDLHAAAENLDEAQREYERASTLLVTPTFLSDTYLKMAQYYAKRGEKEQAIACIEKSVSFYPDRSWKLRQAGEVYFTLDMLDKAIEYFERALQHATTSSADTLASYGELAEIYRRLGQPDKYILYAEKYVETASTFDGILSDSAEGLRYFYRGEVYLAKDEPRLANDDFEYATRYFQSNPTRLSDCYIRMARFQDRFGSRELAIDYGERAVALLPERSYRLQEAGDLFRPMDGMIDRAIELYSGAVHYATSLTARAAATSALADAYKIKGDTEAYHENARKYLDILAERGTEYTDEETGLYNYYMAELYVDGEHYERSYAHYETASRHVTDNSRLADIYMQMAEYQSRHRNDAQATIFAEKSACLLVDQSWKLRQVGNFLARQNEMEKAFCYFDLAMEKAKTPSDAAGVHAGRADAYRARANRVSSDEKIADPQTRAAIRREMEEKFQEQAGIYIDAVDRMGDSAKPTEIGQKWFYCGLLYQMKGEDANAYRSFELANNYLTNKTLRSEALLYMARYNAKWNNRDLAYAQAYESAQLVPGAGWRISPVSRVFVDLNCYQTAVDILCNAVNLNPRDNVSLYGDLANAYVKSGDKYTGLSANEKYIDHLTGVIDEQGLENVSHRLQDDLFDARKRHSRWSKSKWEFDLYLFGNYKQDDTSTVGGMVEVTRNFKFCNDRQGKVYGQLGGNFHGKYSGDYWNEATSRVERWDSNPDFGDTAYALLGVRVSPFKKLGDLSVGVEQLFGLGREMDSDFRFRLLWDQTSGTDPLPYRKYWGYTRTWVNNIYSTRDNDFTSEGTFRKGVTIPWKCNRNLLFIPYVAARYDYRGTQEKSSDRFGVDGGPGIIIRRWFREDKYHAPRSYVELNLYYRFAITSNRENAVGFGFHTSF